MEGKPVEEIKSKFMTVLPFNLMISGPFINLHI